MRPWVLFPLVTLCLFSSSVSLLLDQRKYHGVTVAFSEKLDQTKCEKYIGKIEELFQDASLVMDSAVSLSFQGLKIVIPKTWNSCGKYNVTEADGHLKWSSANIRLGERHPVFGDRPWTDQYRGCGLPGTSIYIPTEFLDSKFKGKVFVHEWAKFRWGVYEEYGHKEDAIFPSYIQMQDNEKIPNYCSNRQLKGKFTCKKRNCFFEAETNILVTSSLMAFPESESVKLFCDEESHKRNLLTKQNLLCSGKSSWEVMKQHPDFLGPSPPTSPFKNSLDIEVLHENNGLNMVIAFENIDSTNDATNRLTFLKESLSQFVKYEIPDSYRVGLVQFADIPVKVTHLTTIDTKGRTDLVEELMGTKPGQSKTRNLERAIQTSAKLLPSGTGSILLLARCTSTSPAFTKEELLRAASGNQLSVIVYPADECIISNDFEGLENTGNIVYINDEILPAQFPYVSPTVRMELSHAMRNQLNIETKYLLQQISKKKCKGSEVVCERSIKVPGGFHDEQYLFFYHDYKEHALATSRVEVYGDGACVRVPMSPVVAGTKIYKCNLSEDAKVDIHVERDRPSDPLLMELVGLPSSPKAGVVINVSASGSLNDLRYSKNTAPILYAEVTGDSRIMYANVTATIHSKSQEGRPDIFLQLNDDGVGADITGNDGIYSAYLLPDIPEGQFFIKINATDNNKKAKMWPTEIQESEDQRCCGSSLIFSGVTKSSGRFSVSSPRIPAKISYKPLSMNFPPGIVRDLEASALPSGKVELKFTAIGSDFDQGIIESYVVSIYDDVYTRASPETTVVPGSKWPGATETFQLEECKENRYYTVKGIDQRRQFGEESNLACIRGSCKVPEKNLSTGSIIGIVFGVMIVIAIILITIIVCRKRKMAQKNIDGRAVSNLPSRKSMGPQVLPPFPGYPSSSRSKPVHSIHDLTDEKLEANIYSDVQQTIPHAPSIESIENGSSSRPESKLEEQQRLMCRTTEVPIKSATLKSISSSGSEGYNSAIPSMNEVGIPLEPFKNLEYNDYRTRSDSDSSGTMV